MEFPTPVVSRFECGKESMARLTLREFAYEMIRLSAIRGRMFKGSGEDGRLDPIEPPVECHHSKHEPPIERFGINDIDEILPSMATSFLTYSVGDNFLAFLPVGEDGQVLKYNTDECRPRWYAINEHREYPIMSSGEGNPKWENLD